MKTPTQRARPGERPPASDDHDPSEAVEALTPEVLDADGNPIGDEDGAGTEAEEAEPIDETELSHEPGVAAFDDDEVDDEEEAQPRRSVPGTLPVLGTSGVPARKGDLLSYYLSEVRQYPLLNPDEEHDLAVRYVEHGDTDAAHRLVTANLRLVVKLAFQYHRQWSNVLDLIQEGNVGLVEALSRYDPYRGIRFSSYAQYWIRAMILRFLMDNYRMVRLGSTRHGRKLFFQLQKERERLIREGVQPSTKALAEALSVPEQEVINVDQHLQAPALSLHAPAGSSEGRPLSEMVGDDGSNNPEERVASSELGAVVQEKLEEFATSLLDERERAIWDQRLTAQDPASLAQLGEDFGVSKERVRQVEVRIKRRLREFLSQKLGDEIDFEFDVPADE